MRTTRPEIKTNDSLTIASGPAGMTAQYRRPQNILGFTEGESPAGKSQDVSDFVEFSSEADPEEEGRGEELAANLLAAWG